MVEPKVDVVLINGKKILVEIEEIDSAVLEKISPKKKESDGRFPQKSEPTGFQDELVDFASSISETLEAIVGSVRKGVANAKPDEWTVELSIGFAGSKDITLPLIKAKGEAKGGIKITAKWKKES